VANKSGGFPEGAKVNGKFLGPLTSAIRSSLMVDVLSCSTVDRREADRDPTGRCVSLAAKSTQGNGLKVDAVRPKTPSTAYLWHDRPASRRIDDSS
jgi:hypothetical protein